MVCLSDNVSPCRTGFLADDRGRKLPLRAARLALFTAGSISFISARRLPRVASRHTHRRCLQRHNTSCFGNASADGDILPPLYASRGFRISSEDRFQSRPLFQKVQRLRKTGSYDVHGTGVQRCRRHGLPHNRLAQRANYSHRNQQLHPLQRSFPDTHRHHHDVLCSSEQSALGSHPRRAHNAFRCGHSRGVKASLQNPSQRSALVVHARASSLPYA